MNTNKVDQNIYTQLKNENNYKGKKLLDEQENPIDLFLINLTNKLNPYYKALHFTPNILTTLSLIVTLLGLYLHYKKYYIIGGILYFIGYYFDCADGNFARTYKMTSEFGDYYDHITDLFKYLVFIYLLYLYKLPKNLIIFIITIIILTLLCSAVYFGCQEKIYEKNNNKGSTTLAFTKKFCYDDMWITYFKYGGTGTLQLFSSLILAFMPQLIKLSK